VIGAAEPAPPRDVDDELAAGHRPPHRGGIEDVAGQRFGAEIARDRRGSVRADEDERATNRRTTAAPTVPVPPVTSVVVTRSSRHPVARNAPRKRAK
jgi:hypothetical protein